jgi:hypothetical protein
MRIIHRVFLSLLAIGAIALTPTRALATPIAITNPGFETGNFTGWTINLQQLGVLQVSTDDPHSGLFAVSHNEGLTAGGPLAPHDEISQVLASTPGTMVTVGFWLSHTENGGAHLEDDFLAEWNGNVMFEIPGIDFPYTHFTFTAPATGSSSTLLFGFSNSFSAPTFGTFHFDDVTADDGTSPTVPEPASLALLGSGLAGLVMRLRRRSA